MVKCLVLTQKMFFVAFPMCFSFFLKWKSKKKLGFFGLFEWIRSIKISKKKINVFFGFSPFLVWFLHWKVSKTKQTRVFCFLRSWLIISIQITKIPNVFCFSISEPKKRNKNYGKQKKSFESKPNILSKVLFFGFFWFCSSSLFFSCSSYSHEWPYPSNFLNNLPLSPCSGILPNEDIKHWHMYMYGNPLGPNHVIVSRLKLFCRYWRGGYHTYIFI